MRFKASYTYLFYILQEFTDKLVEEEELTEDQKDAFKVPNY